MSGNFFQVLGAVPSSRSGGPLPVRFAAQLVNTAIAANVVVARLGPGVSIARAKADLDAVAARLQRSYPNEDSRKIGVNLYPLHSEIVRDYQQILWTLFVAVLLFLAIGCGNLANLLLVRSVARGPEFALRASLGASRLHLLRQLAAEARVLSATGGFAGAGIAVVGLSLWRRFGPADFPRIDEAAFDVRVFAFAVGITLTIALICAVVPARAAVRAQGEAAGIRRSTTTRRERAVQHAFVTVQVAGALVLLVCMGLAVRGFGELERVDAGFTPAPGVVDAVVAATSDVHRCGRRRTLLQRAACTAKHSAASVPPAWCRCVR